MRRIGKLDIVARAEGLSIAIECDRVTPRRKSLAKLRAFPGARVLVLREGLTGPAPEGIDALIGNYDEQYEPEEVCQVAGCGLAAGPEGVCCHCLEDLSGTEPSPTQPRRDDAAEQCDEATVGGRPR